MHDSFSAACFAPRQRFRPCLATSFSLRLIVGLLLLGTIETGYTQLSDKELVNLKSRWNADSVEEMFITGLNAPNGHLVLDAPDTKAKVLSRVEKPAIVMVKVKMIRNGKLYYMSDWSWLRAQEGKKPNWISINPVKGQNPNEGKSTYWEGYYESLRHDGTKWNCSTAYDLFEKSVDRPEVLEFLTTKLATETDIQPKSCVVALLCKNARFSHNADFAATVINMIAAYQKWRVSGYLGQEKAVRQRRDPDRIWHFVSSSGGGLNRLWNSFLVRNAVKYEKLISDTMLDDNADLYLRWVCVHALARHNLIVNYHQKFNPAFFRLLFDNLKNDGRQWNAQFATRILIILAPISAPHITQRLNAIHLDDQEKVVLDLLSRGIMKRENRGLFARVCGGLETDAFEPLRTGDQFEYDLPIFRTVR